MQRPTGVTILAVLCFLAAACLLLIGLLFFVGGSMLAGLAHAGGPGSAIFAMGGAVIGSFACCSRCWILPSAWASSNCRTGRA